MAATEREVRLTVGYAGVQRNVLWISLQEDGSISVGFIDQNVIVEGLTSEQELDGVVHREYLDLATKHRPEAIKNPHFTLHEGAYFHLVSGKNEPLLEGLVWTTPEPGRAVSPWLRFISNPIKELSPTRPIRKSIPIEVHRLMVRSEDCSVAVHLDFVRPEHRPIVTNGNKISHVITWKGVDLSGVAYEVPGQQATLGYLIRG
jgi:hypothetical protein